MRNRILPLLSVLLLAGAFRAAPLEIGGSFLLENLRFDPERPSSEDAFSGRELYWGGSLYGRQAVSDTLSLEASFHRDTVLRYTTYALLRYHEGVVSVSAGPFFGLFNSPHSALRPGMSTAVELAYPGVGLLQLRVDNPIHLSRSQAGDSTQERYEARVGFYIPNAILSFGYEQKRFTLLTAEGETVDSFSGYSLGTDIFQKNVPYRINLALALETLNRLYDESGTITEHTISALVLGTRVDWAVRDFLTVLLDLRSSIYSFGRNDLLGITNPGPRGFLFRLYTGFSLDFGSLPGRRES